MNTIIIFHDSPLKEENKDALTKNIISFITHCGSEQIQIHTLNEEETLKCVMHAVTKPKRSKTDTDILTKVDSWCNTLVKMTGIPSKTISKENFATLIARALVNNINLRNTEVLTRLSQMTENDTELIEVLRLNNLNGFISAKKMAEMLKSLRVLGYVEQ